MPRINYILCFKSQSFVFSAIGSAGSMLNCLTVFPSVTEIMFGVLGLKVKGHPQLWIISVYNPTESPGLIENDLVSGDIFDFNDFLIPF